MLRRGQHVGANRRGRLVMGAASAVDDDPVALLVNFFDCAVVFALAFMIVALKPAADAHARGVEPGAQVKLERFQETQDEAEGEGERLGVAYRLPSGEVVCVRRETKR